MTPGDRRRRLGVLAGWTGLAIATAALLPRIPQDPAYHAFADGRRLLGIPNAADVLSNAAFLAAGLAGLAGLRRARFADPRERRPWALLFGAVALIAPASAAYHLAPGNGTLALDRLPMSVGFASLLVAALAERVDPRAARLLLPLAAAAATTVLHWAATEAKGAGDLRAYAFAQYYPMIAIPLALALFPGPYRPRWGWGAGVGLYAASKLAELADGPVLRATGLVSGHTVKHLVAAAAIAALAAMVATRDPLPGGPRISRREAGDLG